MWADEEVESMESDSSQTYVKQFNKKNECTKEKSLEHIM